MPLASKLNSETGPPTTRTSLPLMCIAVVPRSIVSCTRSLAISSGAWDLRPVHTRKLLPCPSWWIGCVFHDKEIEDFRSAETVHIERLKGRNGVNDISGQRVLTIARGKPSDAAWIGDGVDSSVPILNGQISHQQCEDTLHGWMFRLPDTCREHAAKIAVSKTVIEEGGDLRRPISGNSGQSIGGDFGAVVETVISIVWAMLPTVR